VRIHSKGNTPDYEFYKNKLSLDEYKAIFSDTWNLKSETLSYLKDDLVCLYQVLDKFGKNVFKQFDIQITDCLTIA
jgi:hypothetical protein